MLRRIIVASLVVLGIALQASADTLVLTDAGYQVMTVGPTGAQLSPVVRVDRVVDMRTGVTPTPGPTPGPGPTPDPGTLSPTAKRVKELAEQVGDAQGAQALAIVYDRVAQEAAGGRLNREQVLSALRMASDDVLKATGTKDKWVAWRASVSQMFTDLDAAGNADYAAFCADVSKGLEASSPQGALTPELLQLIIELVLRIIALFTGGGSGV